MPTISHVLRRSSAALSALLLVFVVLASVALAQGSWRLLVVSGLTEAEARGNVEENLKELPNVDVLQDPKDGTFSVVLGYYSTRAAAEEAQKQLQTDSGVMTIGPIEMTGSTLPGADPKGAELENLKKDAVAALAAGNRERARQLWQQIRNTAGPGPLFDEAGRMINELGLAPAAGTASSAPSPAPSSGGGSSLLYIIIGVVALAVVGGVVFFLMKKKEAPRPVPVAAPAIPKPMVPAAPRPVAARAATASASASASASAAPQSRPASSSAAPATAIPLATSITLEESKAGTPHRQRRTSLAENSAVGEVKFDFMDDASGSASGSRPSEQSSRALQFSPLADDMLLGGESRGGQTLLFSQDFAKDPIGKQPANWSGDYEYANLLVEENDGKRALRFEKQSGTGSAYYCCRFPDAQGRIAAEFEIRCDDKNKYLLGFYIEKDQDFRQSIHAIVHRANPNAPPVLKLQNESVDYEFGTWRSIRLEIDLTRQILDAFVDGKQVLVGSRLTQCPNIVNTLSFRDNLATTGILLVRNIRLYSLAA